MHMVKKQQSTNQIRVMNGISENLQVMLGISIAYLGKKYSIKFGRSPKFRSARFAQNITKYSNQVIAMLTLILLREHLITSLCINAATKKHLFLKLWTVLRMVVLNPCISQYFQISCHKFKSRKFYLEHFRINSLFQSIHHKIQKIYQKCFSLLNRCHP